VYRWFKPKTDELSVTKTRQDVHLLTVLIILMTDGVFSDTERRVRVYLSLKKSIKINRNLWKTQNNSLFKCLLRIGVLRVFVLFYVFVFVRAILSWCPYIFGLPFTASQYCFGKVIPVWSFPAFFLCMRTGRAHLSFGRFRYYNVNYRTFLRR